MSGSGLPGSGPRYVGDWADDGRARLRYDDGDGTITDIEHVAMRSTEGFAWGYHGSGPYDAAHAIVRHAAAGLGLGDPTAVADQHANGFRAAMVSHLPLNREFVLPLAHVRDWLGRELHPARNGAARFPGSMGLASLVDRDDARVARLERQIAELKEVLVPARPPAPTQPAVAPAPAPSNGKVVFDAEPVRAAIMKYLHIYDEPLETVALGVGLEPRYVAGIIEGAIPTVSMPEIADVCEALRCSPYDLFGAEGGRALLDEYPPDQWPKHIEPLEELDHEIERRLNPPTVEIEEPRPKLTLIIGERSG